MGHTVELGKDELVAQAHERDMIVDANARLTNENVDLRARLDHVDERLVRVELCVGLFLC